MRGSRGSESTDANRRLAMLWGDGDLIRDPVGSTYPATNQIQTTVTEQLADENSLLRYYDRLLTIRHSYPAIARGIYTAVDGGEKNLGGFLVEYEGEKLLILHNTAQEEQTLDLSACKDLQGESFEKLCDFIGVGTAKLEGSTLTLGPQTSAIVQ